MKFCSITFFFLLSIGNNIFSQKLKSFRLTKPNYSNHSTENIQLPFWDDFSKSDNIDNSYWSESENVKIIDFKNILSPSINVIEFDGLNKDGEPFNNIGGHGICDELISDEINLSSFKLSDSIYISFYWNLNFNGELPDIDDSLKVDFLDEDLNWNTVWYISGNQNNSINNFHFKNILIEEKYLHEKFMFKFYNIGNSQGPFDSWLLDYIYVDRNRSKFDSIYLDRTISHKINKILKSHTSIPSEHISESDNYLDSVNIFIKNLDKDIQPINYSFKGYIPSLNKNIIINDKEPLSPILGGFERRLIKNNPVKLTDYISNNDSTSIDFLFYIESGDSVLSHQNFRNNDSVKFKIDFKNYYSYDDGTAEYAAGLNQKNSELLVKHHTFKKDTLTHVDIFFPKNIFSNYSSQIELVGYKNLDDGNQKFISQDVDINFNGSFNIFELKNPIIIEDSFFIGFRQKEDLFLPVGIDKHTNTSNKIYFKTDNQWYKNEIIQGSLMIRAVFGKSDFILTNIKEIKVTKEIIIYPNPGNGIYKLNKIADIVEIYSLSGKKLYAKNNVIDINIENFESGIYIVKIYSESNWETIKIIKQ